MNLCTSYRAYDLSKCQLENRQGNTIVFGAAGVPVRLHRDFQIPRSSRHDPRYWRISLCNASSLNRGIQLSSGNMCGGTVEFCMRMRFKRDFLGAPSREGGRRRGGGGGGGDASFRAFHPQRLCGISAPRTSRNYISRATRWGYRAPSFARLSLIEIQDVPFRETYAAIPVLNHVVISSEKFRVSTNYTRARVCLLYVISL